MHPVDDDVDKADDNQVNPEGRTDCPEHDLGDQEECNLATSWTEAADELAHVAGAGVVAWRPFLCPLRSGYDAPFRAKPGRHRNRKALMRLSQWPCTKRQWPDRREKASA